MNYIVGNFVFIPSSAANRKIIGQTCVVRA